MAKRTVNMDQLHAELSEYQRPQHHLSIRWTDEMDAAIIKGRDEFRPAIPWLQLQKFFYEKYGLGSEQSLRARYRHLKEKGKRG